ncbi:hypothetical protein ACFVJ5_06945 [Nocardia sp. NPDC127606]|uniref:hypothetical protein n=1 Tax=Nocardia sp. NPDC127606 TaxID=3345406 RepID=UPI0036393587
MISLEPGDLIVYRARPWQVLTCDGQHVELAGLDTDHQNLVVATATVLSDPDVRNHEATTAIAEHHLLTSMTPSQRDRVHFWFEEMYEVAYGCRPRQRRVLPTPPPLPSGTVAARLAAQRDRLAKKNIEVSMSTLWRHWSQFNAEGLVGLADKRGLPGHTRRPSYDYRLHGLIDEILDLFTLKATPSKKQCIELLRRRAAEVGMPVPGRSRLYELFDDLDRGRHTFGPATRRRSQNKSPQRAFRLAVADYPGQEVQLDTTPLDCMIITDTGEQLPVELGIAVDVATRTIAAAILRAVAPIRMDAVELVTRSLVPLPMLPGWDAAWSASRSYLPSELLVPDGEVAAHIAAKPVLDIRGIVLDRAQIFMSHTFEEALKTLGIDTRYAGAGEPTAKPIVERHLRTIAEDFVRWVKSYKGSSVAYRGLHPEYDAVWPLPGLQALLDQWIVTVYQNRTHAGVVHPLMPRKRLTPNDMYRAMSAVTPGAVRSLSRDDWISLQPATTCVLGRRGIQLNRLHYDASAALTGNGRPSPGVVSDRRATVHYDPTNLMAVWVRDYDNNTWIECPWYLAGQVSAPFGLDVLNAIREGFDDPARVPEKEVARRTEELHHRLWQGPDPEHPAVLRASRKERRASTRNLTLQQLPAPTGRDDRDPTTPPPAPTDPDETTEDDEQPRVRTPLPVARRDRGW